MKKLVILVLVALTACTGKLSKEEGFMLYYPSLTEICPGTTINLTPSWVGGMPENFSIAGARLESGEECDTQCFSVDGKTGVFSISGSDGMPIGNYTIDIACSVGGVSHRFDKIVKITFMKSVPDGIKVTPSELEIPVDDIREGTEDLPGAVIEPDGEGFVKIKSFLLKNVYKDGELLPEEYKSWFRLDEKTGKFSVVPGIQEFLPGTYMFDFKLTTYKVGASDEAGIYSKALTLRAVSAPYDLFYAPAVRKVEVGTAVSSPAPSFMGTHEGTQFSIKEVNPAEGHGITIDSATGILTMSAPAEGMIGNSYVVSITAANSWGTAQFDEAFRFDVISFIHPITTLSYANVGGIVSGNAFSNTPVQVDGDDVTFSLIELPAALEKLSIDVSTGTVSCAAGVAIEPGTYTVTVLAQNSKGQLKASFELEIITNPNNFTHVYWGNNLGLEPIEKYGNQFRVYQGSAKSVFPILETDIPEGRPVKYTLTNKTAMGGHGAVIKKDGTIEIAAQAAGGRVWVHYLMITVQVGADDDVNKVIRNYPLFIDQCGYTTNGYKIEYTPFALRVNPRTGGVGPVPVIVDKDGNPAPQPTLDFRANPSWYNLNGPATHLDGAINKNKDSFLKCVWDKYYTAIGTAPNYGAWNPVSYWLNKDNGRLPFTGAYIDGDNNLQLVVNADKFVDDDGYGDGVMSCICNFNLNGVSPLTAGFVQVTPIVIWLDPNYNE